MNTNIVPLLSEEISFNPLNKNEYFIHQVVYDHRIKISADLYNFVQLIDNQKDLNNIVEEYNQKYNSSLTVEIAYGFLYDNLAVYGIIQSDKIAIKQSQKPNYIRLNFIVINERIVAKFTRQLHFLFQSKISKAILLLGFLTLGYCFYTFSQQIFHTGVTKSQWLFYFGLSFIGVTFHELGHASAAHHYGAKHGGIGGGFYLFMPVYFADVTDIWKLPKRQRIVVNLAGMYFELIYVLFLIWMGLLFNHPVLMIFGCFILLSSLRNLNPFLRSDGYWVLSDAIEKPNLMVHGFFQITQIFKSKKGWSVLDHFLLIYGLITYSMILFFVYYVLIRNPDSILYFPQNVKHFIENLFLKSGQFSIVELGRLFIPALFFYLIFGLLKKFVPFLIRRGKRVLLKMRIIRL